MPEVPSLTGMEYQTLAGQYAGSIRRVKKRKSKYEPKVYLVEDLGSGAVFEMGEAMLHAILKKPGRDVRLLRRPS